jgi:hypothetical protein
MDTKFNALGDVNQISESSVNMGNIDMGSINKPLVSAGINEDATKNIGAALEAHVAPGKLPSGVLLSPLQSCSTPLNKQKFSQALFPTNAKTLGIFKGGKVLS